MQRPHLLSRRDVTRECFKHFLEVYAKKKTKKQNKTEKIRDNSDLFTVCIVKMSGPDLESLIYSSSYVNDYFRVRLSLNVA